MSLKPTVEQAAAIDAFQLGRNLKVNAYAGTGKTSTLQMSRWAFRDAIRNGNKLFVVITRQDSGWSTTNDEAEPYAIAVVLADRENITINLYERIRAVLEARAQVRSRARARG